MADDPHNTSDISDQVETSAAKEDAETTAARRELKQTSISEKAGQQPSTSQDDKSASDDDNAPKDKAAAGARNFTPPVALGVPSDETLAEQISSPKKKRAHAELDENKDVAEAPLEGEATATTDNKNTTAVTINRTNRSEPEKKRPRDRQASASAVKSGQEEVEPLSASASPRSSMEELAKSPPAATTTTVRSPTTEKPQTTSSSAFAASGFAKLGASAASPFAAASGASPFASAGAGAGKPSIFGSAGTSSFGSVLGGSTAPAPAKLNFSSTSTASPFASALNGQASGGSVFKSSPFGSSFGGASALSGGPRLTSFGKPGEALKSGKPAKPFGAPESDAEDDDKDEDGEENGEGAGVDGEEEHKDDEEKEESERKRLKLHKIVVDDGESSEVTLFSQRAKMYVMEKGVGWKERGAGMLKVNVPRATVEFENDGSPDANSFDASVLEDKDYSGPKNVRLIMRQDHTLRVILNTVVLPAMHFKIEKKLKAATVLFTAFENGEAQLVQMKLSNANADLFSDLVEMLKKGLADI
ncbi:hypothetical protein QBC40DRAFT_217661 [Triangularia verruculosa]|uniref:RanBD1 domain-containing protein n=1 Tax=Triangularia verruculosa TaxID=2587418 RepID=A0AAN6XNU9_9PEZI|nr:hypothetical protein QBC40DRAFT_217661 [Triangularia verruculosa]